MHWPINSNRRETYRETLRFGTSRGIKSFASKSTAMVVSRESSKMGADLLLWSVDNHPWLEEQAAE